MASGGAVGRLGSIFPSTSPARTDDLQTQIRHRAHRGAEYTERKSGHKSPRAPQLLLLWRAPSRRLRAPWATRAFPPGCAKCCASKNRTLEIDPSQLPSRLPSNLRAGRASPSRLRVKGCGTRRTDPKRAYIYYSAASKEAHWAIILRSPPEARRSRTVRLQPQWGRHIHVRHRSLRNVNESVNICSEPSLIDQIFTGTSINPPTSC
jgi:hypothetical protein